MSWFSVWPRRRIAITVRAGATLSDSDELDIALAADHDDQHHDDWADDNYEDDGNEDQENDDKNDDQDTDDHQYSAYHSRNNSPEFFDPEDDFTEVQMLSQTPNSLVTPVSRNFHNLIPGPNRQTGQGIRQC